MSDSSDIMVAPPSQDNRLMLSAMMVFLLPSLVFVGIGASSLAPGMLMASVLVGCLHFRHVVNFRFSFPVAALLTFFWLGAVSAAYSLLDYSESKPVMSLVILLMLLAALVMGRRLEEMDPGSSRITLFRFVGLLLLLGWIALVWTPGFLGYSALEKPVFPFSEESHYALSLGVLACGVIYAETFLKSIFVLVNMLALSLLFPNLTLLVFVFVGAFLFCMRFPPWIFWSIALLGVFVSLVGYFVVLPQFSYFADRLDFSDSDNLTTLVYLQGWGLAWLNLLDTQGAGVGFQMLGEEGTRYPYYTDKIVDLTGQEFNVPDAGFVAAKWVAELGWLGLLMAVIFLAFLVWFACRGNAWRYRLWHLSIDQQPRYRWRLMLLAAVFGLVVEIFLRGYGYFSPGIFWMVSALYAVHCDRARSLS